MSPLDTLKLSSLISEGDLQDKVKELGQKLTERFKDEPITAVCILNGSFIFFSDLIREIESDVRCDFIGVSSYGASSKSSGIVKITMDLSQSIEGKNILLVEDIVDTGLTMNFLQNSLKVRNPKSITSVTLLHKPSAQKVECEVDYVGFEIPNDFVVGYGLDYQGYYRNLPYIAQVQNLN